MKTTVLIMAFLLTVTSCGAAMHHNSKYIPGDALKAFSQQYANMHVKKWKDRNDTCIARFKMDKKISDAFYLANGNWIKTETAISEVSDLPKAVENSWHLCPFQVWYIQGIKQLETKDQNLYVIQVTRRFVPADNSFSDFSDYSYSKIYKLYFNENGALIKKSQLN